MNTKEKTLYSLDLVIIVFGTPGGKEGDHIEGVEYMYDNDFTLEEARACFPKRNVLHVIRK